MNKKAVFIIFTAALLVFPLSYPLLRPFIDTSTHENRALSELPVLSSVSELGSYTSALETFFNDRLPYKNQLVAANATLRSSLDLDQTVLDFLVGGQVIRGEDDWLFYNASETENTLDDYLCTNLYTEEELQEIADGYTALNDQYEADGIQFILFIPPNKEQVYPEYMPRTLKPAGDISRTDQLVSYLQENTDVTVIYAKQALVDEKENGYQVFYKYDTHWNKLGGFVGTQLLRKELKGKGYTLSEVEVGTTEDAVPNDLAGVLGLAGTLAEEKDWVVFDYEPEVEAEITSPNDQPLGEYISFSSNADDTRTLLMIKDSFAVNMMEPLAKDYANTVFVTDSEQAKEYIRNNHPEIVVLEIVERQHYRVELQWRELLTEGE